MRPRPYGLNTPLPMVAAEFIVRFAMQTSIIHPQLGPSDLEANSTFNVVIAYENFAAGKHAKETYDVLTRNLGHECRFSHQMWNFDVLGNPKLREMAAADAAQADIVIVSFESANKLPGSVKAWIEQWLDKKANAIALVALFASPGEEGAQSRATREYLADVARRGRMEFFAQPRSERNPADNNGSRDPSRASQLDLGVLPTFAAGEQLDLSYPRWGINE
jgi:hypothetical protein